MYQKTFPSHQKFIKLCGNELDSNVIQLYLFNTIILDLKVPMSPNFLYFHSKGHIKKRTSAKKFFDLNETRFFYDFLKTLKLTAILAHHSSQSAPGDSGLVT